MGYGELNKFFLEAEKRLLRLRKNHTNPDEERAAQTFAGNDRSWMCWRANLAPVAAKKKLEFPVLRVVARRGSTLGPKVFQALVHLEHSVCDFTLRISVFLAFVWLEHISPCWCFQSWGFDR